MPTIYIPAPLQTAPLADGRLLSLPWQQWAAQFEKWAQDMDSLFAAIAMVARPTRPVERLRAVAYQTSNQTITSGAAFTSLTFDAEDYDYGTLHSLTVNTSRFTVPPNVNSFFVAWGQVSLGAHNGDRYLRVLLNGVTVRGQNSDLAVSANNNWRRQILTPPMVLKGGDYIEFQVSQNSGVSLITAPGLGETFGSLIEVPHLIW